jgi:hypothetical protein
MTTTHKEVKWMNVNRLCKETKKDVWEFILIALDKIKETGGEVPDRFTLSFSVEAKDVRRASILEPNKHRDMDFIRDFDSFGLKRICSKYEVRMDPLRIESCKVVKEF